VTRRVVACGLFLALAIASPARAGWLSPHTFAVSPEPHEEGGSVAVTANGRAIVATQRFDGVSNLIQVSERAGPDTKWQPPRRLSAFAANVNSPRAALDEAGDAIVVWTQATSEYYSAVRAALRLGPGASWSPPVQISPPGEWASGGEVAFDGQGNATVVWANNTRGLIQARTWDATTHRWGVPESISTGPPHSGPRIAVSPSGRAVVAWSAPSGYDYLVRAAIRPSRTGSWGPEQLLSTAGQTASVDDIVEQPSGQTIVMWDRFEYTTDYLEVATLPAGSLAWGPPETLSRPGTNGHNGTVDIGPDGTAIAAWQRDIELEQVGVEVSIRAPTDTQWSTPEPIAEHAFNPAVAATAAGDAVVVFGQAAWWPTIEARVRDAITGAWGPVAKLSQPVFETSPHSIAADSLGGVFVVWQTLSEQCRCFSIQGADYVGGGPDAPIRRQASTSKAFG
jgi:hypothetical protein